MRGIPRLAAHRHMGILGTDIRADSIADPASICSWNPYMYGVRPVRKESQIYYDSVYALYAEWGIDFVKVDDICREDAASAHAEIAMIHKAIEKSGRPMVLSLSPGPALISEAQFYSENANMWRITDDFWDSWELLRDMFRRCELWQGKAGPGAFPDCDMLPVGQIGGCFDSKRARESALTPEEQKTMMTLWCICRSPLMIGAKLTSLDDETLNILTNEGVLGMLKYISISRQILRTEEKVVWKAYDPQHNAGYIALFNLADEERTISLWLNGEPEPGYKPYNENTLRELWSGKELQIPSKRLAVLVPAHGVRLLRY